MLRVLELIVEFHTNAASIDSEIRQKKQAL